MKSFEKGLATPPQESEASRSVRMAMEVIKARADKDPAGPEAVGLKKLSEMIAGAHPEMAKLYKGMFLSAAEGNRHDLEGMIEAMGGTEDPGTKREFAQALRAIADKYSMGSLEE